MLSGRDVEDEAIRIAVLTLGLRALADVDLSAVDASRCLNPLRALLEDRTNCRLPGRRRFPDDAEEMLASRHARQTVPRLPLRDRRV
jgi:hypothetical protein